MILGPILDHIFGPKKDKLFCPVFVFRRGMSNAICDLVLYLQEWKLKQFMNISWYNLIPILKNGIRNTVFYSVTNRKPVYFSKVWWIDIPLKEETMKNIHNQNVAGLAHCMIVSLQQKTRHDHYCGIFQQWTCYPCVD